jgi:protein gp37
MAGTKIEWADAVWNPITGCTPISEGCANCYAKRMANRLKGRSGYPADDPFRISYHQDRVSDPFSWSKAKRVFVCSMADLFHEDVDFRSIRRLIAGMLRPYGRDHWHTFMILTKRPQRMQEFFEWLARADRTFTIEWPLPNVWLGVTAENQARADERIPVLLQIPAAVRFVSIEPMLGPVDFQELSRPFEFHQSPYGWHQWWPKKLHWVICGGETGPGARPVNPDWARGLRDQCQTAGVPFFFKGWGKWIQNPSNAGKRLLDGREWSEFPA